MEQIDFSRYEAVYFNHGVVNLKTVIRAYITREHWLIVGADWWQMGRFTWSDIPAVECELVNLGDINLRGIIKSHSWTASQVLLSLSLSQAVVV